MANSLITRRKAEADGGRKWPLRFFFPFCFFFFLNIFLLISSDSGHFLGSILFNTHTHTHTQKNGTFSTRHCFLTAILCGGCSSCSIKDHVHKTKSKWAKKKNRGVPKRKTSYSSLSSDPLRGREKRERERERERERVGWCTSSTISCLGLEHFDQAGPSGTSHPFSTFNTSPTPSFPFIETNPKLTLIAFAPPFDFHGAEKY